VFLCALIVSIQMILNRKLRVYSHPLIISFWGASCATLLLTPLLSDGWSAPDSSEVLLIGLMIVSGAVSQVLIVFAFAKSEASKLAPFTYFELIAAVAIGYAFFGTVPDWVSWGGMTLICVCGVAVARAFAKKAD